MNTTKAQSTLAEIVDIIADDVALIQARVNQSGAKAELNLDDARRVAVYADRLEAIVRHEKVRPLKGNDMQSLIERASKIPELLDALKKFQGVPQDEEPSDDG